MKRFVLFLPVLAFVGLACAPAPPPPVAGPAIPTCFDETVNPATGDVLYSGPLDTLANLQIVSSVDGSCSGSVGATFTAVVAAGAPSALALCQSLNPSFTLASNSAPPSIAPQPGPYFWICQL